ncbi:MAG TPA: hypothetical protein HPQ04_10990 [Rhodospirillaceae bacterium]|nr:hypothetical protein [Rhodospirillaceae bacterium]
MDAKRQDWITTARDNTIAAIREGRIDDAIRGVGEIWAEGRPIHDFYGDMSAVFCDFIAQELGEEAVEKAWRYLGERLWKPVFEAAAAAGAEPLAGLYAMFLRSHGYDFRVEEDDEKITFLLDYCPSGQRLMMEGKLEGDSRHPLNHGVSKKPYPWTFGKTGVPYYCGHTELWFNSMPKEWGNPIMSTQFGEFDADGKVTGSPCRTFFWKRQA